MVTDRDLMEFTRAVRDEVRQLISSEMRRLEDGVMARLARMLEDSQAVRDSRMGDEISRQVQEVGNKAASQMAALIDLVRSLPAPTVTFAPQIDVPASAPPTVTVNVPEAGVTVNLPAPNVTVEAPNVSVNVPEQAVTVNVPEAAVTVNVPAPQVSVAAPTVTVSAPEPKLLKKFITYDEKGRPSQITETDLI